MPTTVHVTELSGYFPMPEGNLGLSANNIRTSLARHGVTLPKPGDYEAISQQWYYTYVETLPRIETYISTIGVPPNIPRPSPSLSVLNNNRSSAWSQTVVPWLELYIKVNWVSGTNISLEVYFAAEHGDTALKQNIFRIRRTGDTKWDVQRSDMSSLHRTHPEGGNTGDNNVALPVPSVVPAPDLGFLPPNLSSGFGGFDASYAFGSLESFRPNVFDLDISDPALSKAVRVTGTDGTTQEYTVPSFLNFTWGTESTFFSASGSSKIEFIRDLSEKVDIGFSFLGFGAEFERTFKQYNREETFNKYVALYDQEIIYKVGFKDTESAKRHLSADMKNALATWSADRLVEQFGTHFMTAAWFGGLRINSSTTDKLDTFSKTELIEALKTKIPLKDPETGVNAGDVRNNPERSDVRSTSLAEALDVVRTTTVGGTAPDGDKLEGWRRTLATNPSVVLYKSKTIDTLVDDPVLKAALQQAIRDRLSRGQPIDSCKLLAIRVPLTPYYSDRDSGGKHDISVAYPAVPKGWYAVGQFAQSAALENSFWGKSYAIAVRPNPNFELDSEHPAPALFGATSCLRRWHTYRQGNQYGMFTPVFDTPYEQEVFQKYPALRGAKLRDQYVALGDVFENAADPQGVRQNSLERVACFHLSCLRELPAFPPKIWVWDDSGTGGTPDVTVMGAPNLVMPDGKPGEPRQMVIQAPETGPSYLFKCLARGNDGSLERWFTLDWDKVKWLENKWMADIPALRARM